MSFANTSHIPNCLKIAQVPSFDLIWPDSLSSFDLISNSDYYMLLLSVFHGKKINLRASARRFDKQSIL